MKQHTENDHIIVSLWDGGEITIDEIYGYSLDEVLSMQSDIEGALSEYLPLPDGAICQVYDVLHLEWHDAQIGCYPPPNVEMPSYWGAYYKLEKTVYEADLEVTE
jgi:hypothetical protein